jgi:hypothetical protein
MYMMGLSSAGYLGGKLARKAGPIINEISVTPQESDSSIGKATAGPPPGPPSFAQPLAQAQSEAKNLINPPAGNAQNAVNALSAGITAVSQVKTLANAQAAMTELNARVLDAEKEAKAAADAFATNSAPPDARRAAEIAQKAAGALHDLASAVSSALDATLPATSAQRPMFTRVIELRGRNLSNQATLEIDGIQLPFRMLAPNPDAKNERLPQVVVREPDDPNLAMILRLIIDPSQLEDPDFNLYKRWFGSPTATATSGTKKQTFSLTNLDGQNSDVSFTVL